MPFQVKSMAYYKETNTSSCYSIATVQRSREGSVCLALTLKCDLTQCLSNNLGFNFQMYFCSSQVTSKMSLTI